jgi:phage host-nuclease inhibitor protein Gam
MSTQQGILVTLLVGVVVGGWLGYQFGTRKLESTEAELAKIQNTLDLEKQQYQATIADLNKKAKQIDAEHKNEQTRITSEYAGREKQLKASNSDAGKRIEVLDNKIKSINREREENNSKLLTATGQAKVELEKKNVSLGNQVVADETEKSGLNCLKVPVPAEQINILKQQSSL